ncbi:thioredoxin family protein [Cohnella suwonensis]|uniref:Thioredoxin family protein n=1 Tax=Cohnella suwonensis TaxID=696072 RepID=A0ABW0LPA0_9BACL
MREWDPANWMKEWTFASAPFAVFVHTPLCGTCLAAKKMLAVAEALVPELPVSAANLNVMPGLAQRFQIESVPCLLVKKASGEWTKNYRFPSVTELVETMRNARDGR